MQVRILLSTIFLAMMVASCSGKRSSSSTSLKYPSPVVLELGVADQSVYPVTYSGRTDDVYTVSPELPMGLMIDQVTGAIYGTPQNLSEETTYTITLENEDAILIAEVVLSVEEISDSEPPTSLTYSVNPAVYSKGVAITPNEPTNLGGDATDYSISPSLPSGFSFNQSTGVISGTPTNTQSKSSYVITASNDAGETSVTLEITVTTAEKPKSLTYTDDDAEYFVGTAITDNIASYSGGAATSFTIEPSLPAGLSFNTLTGKISGTPTATSSEEGYYVTAKNSMGSTAKTIYITVNPTKVTLPFKGGFGTSSTLSDSWTVESGSFSVASSKATSTSTTNNAASAALYGVSRHNISVEAYIDITNQTSGWGGVAIRQQDTSSLNLYAAVLQQVSGAYYLYIYEVNNGTFTSLASISTTSGKGTIRFEGAGSSLKLFFNDTLKVLVYDSTHWYGTAGIIGSTNVKFSEFYAENIVLTTPSNPFTDDFSNPVDAQLSYNWRMQSGVYSVSSNTVTGSTSYDNIATLNGISISDMRVSADVTVGSRTDDRSIAGVVARYNDDGNFYLAALHYTSSAYKVGLWKKVSGTWTQIGGYKTVSASSGKLELVVLEDQLTVFFASKLLFTVTDSSIDEGTAGVFSREGSFKNFKASSE